jgi:hypothetical protein
MCWPVCFYYLPLRLQMNTCTAVFLVLLLQQPQLQPAVSNRPMVVKE